MMRIKKDYLEKIRLDIKTSSINLKELKDTRP
jgi:hypothetical protein